MRKKLLGATVRSSKWLLAAGVALTITACGRLAHAETYEFCKTVEQTAAWPSMVNLPFSPPRAGTLTKMRLRSTSGSGLKAQVNVNNVPTPGCNPASMVPGYSEKLCTPTAVGPADLMQIIVIGGSGTTGGFVCADVELN